MPEMQRPMSFSTWCLKEKILKEIATVQSGTSHLNKNHVVNILLELLNGTGVYTPEEFDALKQSMGIPAPLLC